MKKLLLLIFVFLGIFLVAIEGSNYYQGYSSAPINEQIEHHSEEEYAIQVEGKANTDSHQMFIFIITHNILPGNKSSIWRPPVNS